jgi:hypothetical protein
MPVKPIDLIKSDLGEDLWKACYPRSIGELSPVENLSPFQSSKTYIVRGKTGQIDFVSLPHGSYCYYVVDHQKAVRLTRAGREIESVLRENWPTLQDCHPVKLASLILNFFDGGIRSSHAVLPDAEKLHAYQHHVLDNEELERVQDLIGTTIICCQEDEINIRAVTLCGWMHNKQNLGIERIRISKCGNVQLDKREVLSERIFKSVPQIMY